MTVRLTFKPIEAFADAVPLVRLRLVTFDDNPLVLSILHCVGPFVKSCVVKQVDAGLTKRIADFVLDALDPHAMADVQLGRGVNQLPAVRIGQTPDLEAE